MISPNILSDTAPVLDDHVPTLARSIITDAWGLHFAQGGVVMAAALRAMSEVLDREDLSLASASATFCRPVACGPVETMVDVLRNGRRGAQVQGTLRDQTATGGAVSVSVTGVFTDPRLTGPFLTPLSLPAELRQPPDPEAVSEPLDHDFPFGFLDNTEWRVATGAGSPMGSDGPLPTMSLWFRFSNPPAATGLDWNPALLPIPGDSLGSALSVALAGGDTAVGSVSLQMDIQVLAPIRGTWVGIESMCTHAANGLATGILHLWGETGAHVATVSQTAMLREFATDGGR
jgi:acyl-CoA thioesterase